MCTQNYGGLSLMLGMLFSHFLLYLLSQGLPAECATGDAAGPDSWPTLGVSDLSLRNMAVTGECLCPPGTYIGSEDPAVVLMLDRRCFNHQAIAPTPKSHF